MSWPKNKNKYGLNDFNNPSSIIEPYMTETSGEVVYICFFNTPLRAIHRISTVNSIVVKEKAWGSWNNRATLEYEPIND